MLKQTASVFVPEAWEAPTAGVMWPQEHQTDFNTSEGFSLSGCIFVASCLLFPLWWWAAHADPSHPVLSTALQLSKNTWSFKTSGEWGGVDTSHRAKLILYMRMWGEETRMGQNHVCARSLIQPLWHCLTKKKKNAKQQQSERQRLSSDFSCIHKQ